MRYLLFLSFLFFTNFSYSAEYYWEYNSGVFLNPIATTDLKFSSPSAACAKVEQLSLQSYPIFVSKNIGPITPYSSTFVFTCTVVARNSGGGSGNYQTTFVRRGTECALDTVYDPLTGECKGDQCKEKEGQPQRISKSGMKNDLFTKVIYSSTLKRNFYVNPPVACFEGCQVDIDKRMTCTLDIAGQYRCGGTGVFNGSSCSTDFPTTDPDPSGTDPVPQKRNSDEPCVYGTVNGVTGCTTIKKHDSDGIFGGPKDDSTCSSPDGCNGVDPLSKEDRIKTDINTVTNPDGSITTTKTDVKTVTSCKSNNTNCTTSTTTKTSSTTTGANGNPISSGGTCQGDQCPGDTNPDGDGDGFGDCVGDDCGDDSESKVGGESCSAELSCDGDAIQCAILRQEKENNCKWSLGTEEQASVVSAVSGEGFELQETNISVSGIFNDALAQGRWLSSTCPVPRTLSVRGKTISFSWEPLCDFATAIGPIIVALASLFFAIFVFRGVKGS